MGTGHFSDGQMGEYLEMAYHKNPYFKSNYEPYIQKLHKANDIYALFKKGPPMSGADLAYERRKRKDPLWTPESGGMLHTASPTTTIPWGQATRNKVGLRYDPTLVNRTIQLGGTESLREFDPRYLHGSQPSVTASGVGHYLSSEAEQTGALYADHSDIGNQYPFVYIHSGTGQHRLIGGHHRAAAALLKGKPLLARFAIGDY